MVRKTRVGRSVYVPTFYKCQVCRYWHPARQTCRPAHNGYTVAVLDALYPDRTGDRWGAWRAVRAPKHRTR